MSEELFDPFSVSKRASKTSTDLCWRPSVLLSADHMWTVQLWLIFLPLLFCESSKFICESSKVIGEPIKFLCESGDLFVNLVIYL